MIKKILDTLKSIKFWTIVSAIATVLTLLYTVWMNDNSSNTNKVLLGMIDNFSDDFNQMDVTQIPDDIDTIYVITQIDLEQDNYIDSLRLYSIPLPFVLYRTEDKFIDNVIYCINAGKERFQKDNKYLCEINRIITFDSIRNIYINEPKVINRVKLEMPLRPIEESLTVMNPNLVTDGFIDFCYYTIEIFSDGQKGEKYNIFHSIFINKDLHHNKIDPSSRYVESLLFNKFPKYKKLYLHYYYCKTDKNNVVHVDGDNVLFTQYWYKGIEGNYIIKNKGYQYDSILCMILLVIIAFILIRICLSIMRIFILRKASSNKLSYRECAWITGNDKTIFYLCICLICSVIILLLLYSSFIKTFVG